MKKTKKLVMSWLLAFCCVITLVAPSVVNAAADDFEIIDDTDARFVYSDGNANNGGWESAGAGDASVTEHWSNTAGATLDITFNGTKLELYGKKAANHAMFSVSIDGSEAVECDAYAAVTEPEAKLFESKTLAAGNHTAHITVLEKRNEASTGTGSVYGVQFVYAKAFEAEIAEPEFPGYTEVDDAVFTTNHEPFKIQYEPAGAWTAGSGNGNLFYNGTEHYSAKGVDVSYEMIFTGTGVEIHASKNTVHMNCDVYIDDVKVGELAAQNAGAMHKQKLFEKKDLANTKHTLRVVPKEGESIEGKVIQLDKIVVFHDEITVPDSIVLNRTELTMTPGASSELTASVIPWNANAKLVWTSSDSSVVEVNDGKLTAKEIDVKKTVTVTAASAEDNSVLAEAKITVDPALAFMNAYVGNEKLLETELDYDKLKAGNGSVYNGTAWLNDELNSKIVVTTEKDVHNVQVTASDFKNEKGQVLSKDNIDIKWLKEIAAKEGRNAQGQTKNYPDVIYKGGKKDIDAQDVQFAWVNITIPKDTAAGNYTGTITVSADELDKPFELTYNIEVLNLVQPAPEATELQVWQHPFSVANYYLGLGENPSGGITNEVREDFYFTEKHFNLMRDSIKEYVSIGGHDVVANVVEEAWNHQSYYNDLSMVKWTKKADGTWEFDYDWYDAWINFMIKCKVLDPANGIGQIKCYSIVPWNNQIAYYDEAQGKVVKESHNPGTAKWKEMWEPFLKDFMEHSKKMGWFDITYISMDERGLDQLEPAVEMIESVKDEDGNHFKISSALNYAAPEYYEFTDRIDDISINLGNTGNVQQMNDLSDHRRDLGLTTTMYTCTGDYPSNFMISDPGDNYWDIWYTMTLGTDGYMRWAWDNYVYDMHGDATYRYWEPGDGWFIYPMEREAVGEDFNASFYSTPRYELFKQGIRDVAKAKYLLNSESATAEEKTELTDVVEHLAKPQKGTYQGSAVAASEKDRMLVHSETERALDATNALARNVAERENPNPKPESADKTALNAAIKDAEALKKEDYTAESWKAFETALNAAKETAADKDAAQTEVDNALNVLNAAVAKLEKVKDPNQQQPVQPQPEQTKPDKTTPQTGDRTNAALLFGCAVLSGAGVFFAYRRRRTIK